MRFLGRGVMWAACSVTALANMAADARVVHMPEICMRVTVPNGRHICPDLSLTWGFLHGIVFDIDPNRRCGKDRAPINRIGIWFDANMGDETIRDYMKIACKNSKITAITQSGLRLSGMRSTSCIFHQSRRDLRVNLVGYAGIWDGKASQPAVFYRAWMITQPRRLHRDMTVFKAFVRSAKIEGDSCLSYLSH